MSADLSRAAAEPGLPAGRADSLRWVLGSICTGLGSLILVAPHRFSFPLFATATGLRQAWGITALLGGVTAVGSADRDLLLDALGCLWKTKGAGHPAPFFI